MSEWHKKIIGPKISILSGYPFNSDCFTIGEGTPLLRIRDLSNESTEVNYNGQFSEIYIVKKGDFLVGMDGDFHTVLWKGNNVLLNQRVCKIKSKDENEINTLYLYYRLIQEIKKINSLVSATTVKHLSVNDIFNLELELPGNKEQTRIAEILRTADEALAHTEAMITKYQRIKTGLMQDLLTKGIDENGNIRNKATHKFVVKNGMEVPEKWEVDDLENRCNLHNNLRKPIAAIDRFQNKGSFPYYGATGIIDYINEYRVEGKYVLIGEDGDHYLKFKNQEMTHLVNGKFNVSNHAHVLSGKNECFTEWIHYFFSHRDITYYLTRQGAGRFKLNKAALQKLPICVPSSTEQTRIIEMIVCFNDNFNLEKQKYVKLQSLKTGLMQDLLSGKVRIKI